MGKNRAHLTPFDAPHRRHGVVVVSAIPHQQGNPCSSVLSWGLSVPDLHALLVSVRVKSKNMHVRLIGDSKFTVASSVSMHVCSSQ